MKGSRDSGSGSGHASQSALGRGARKPALLWLSLDLRLADNDALAAALRHATPVLPVFVWAPDLANNTLGWQRSAGCGADAAPYFRIFNPVLQGDKFDPEGEYVRRWLPELAGLPRRWIHQPWKAPAPVLAQAGVELGVTYPAPLVAHEAARKRALAAFAHMRQR